MPRLMVSRQSPASLLIAVAVIIGLLSVPVECAVADGPHSIFTEARMLAAMQHGLMPDMAQPAAAMPSQEHHHHGDGMDSGAVRTAQDAPASHPAPDISDNQPGAKLTFPKPAGFAGDAIVAVSTSDGVGDLPGGGSWVRIGTARTAAPEQLLRGPEPPPPWY